MAASVLEAAKHLSSVEFKQPQSGKLQPLQYVESE